MCAYLPCSLKEKTYCQDVIEYVSNFTCRTHFYRRVLCKCFITIELCSFSKNMSHESLFNRLSFKTMANCSKNMALQYYQQVSYELNLRLIYIEPTLARLVQYTSNPRLHGKYYIHRTLAWLVQYTSNA